MDNKKKRNKVSASSDTKIKVEKKRTEVIGKFETKPDTKLVNKFDARLDVKFDT